MKTIVIEGKAGMKRCAFCKHWYDPTNSAIVPKKNKLWEYDSDARSICRKRNSMKTKANYTCNKFECKL